MTTTRQPVPALAPVAFLEGKEGHRMKLTRFPRELRLSIPQTCGTEVSHAAARGPWLTGALTCDSGSRAARSGFVSGPAVDRGHLPAGLGVFFAPSAVPDRLAQLRDQACVTENPTAEIYAGIAVRPSLFRTPARSMPPASCHRRFPLKPRIRRSKRKVLLVQQSRPPRPFTLAQCGWPFSSNLRIQYSTGFRLRLPTAPPSGDVIS